ncbi:hypothetical protein HY991_05920 [Candidatus Micrarchaeota archaeon]|nr:hypothetical protein [Candidatus Micrarchaeota archaeon]
MDSDALIEPQAQKIYVKPIHHVSLADALWNKPATIRIEVESVTTVEKKVPRFLGIFKKTVREIIPTKAVEEKNLGFRAMPFQIKKENDRIFVGFFLYDPKKPAEGGKGIENMSKAVYSVELEEQFRISRMKNEATPFFVEATPRIANDKLATNWLALEKLANEIPDWMERFVTSVSFIKDINTPSACTANWSEESLGSKKELILAAVKGKMPPEMKVADADSAVKYVWITDYAEENPEVKYNTLFVITDVPMQKTKEPKNGAGKKKGKTMKRAKVGAKGKAKASKQRKKRR